MKKSIFIFLFFMTLFSEFFGQSGTPDHLQGYFLNQENQLSLTVEKLSDGTFQGAFSYQGNSYPFVGGIRLLGMLSASYEMNGNYFPFTLSLEEGNYYITSEGNVIPMNKISANPLDGSAQSQSVSSGSSQNPGNPTASIISTSAPAASGTRYKDEYGAFSFQVPSGWTVSKETGSFVFSKSGTEIKLGIATHNYHSLTAIESEIQPLIDAASGTNLKPVSGKYGSQGVWARFEGTANGNPTVVENISLLSPYGGGVNIASVGTPSTFTEVYSQALKTIANSVQFSKPVLSADAQQWHLKLNGKQLLYLYTGNGYSEKTSFDLCANGNFVAAGDNSYLSGGFSGATANANEGTWKITSASSSVILILFFNGGATKEFALSSGREGNEIGLNGERYFIQSSTACN